MKFALRITAIVLLSLLYVATHASAGGTGLAPEQQAKVDTLLKDLSTWGTDTKIVEAVKSYNANPPEQGKALTNEKWKSLTLLDPFVRSLSKNEVVEYVKSKKKDVITEIFISGADGGKVAFLSKTTSWTHKGKPKHDEPMTGKNWQGPVEVDESSGVQQVQISVPVLDDTTPIGSIVFGLSLAKL